MVRVRWRHAFWCALVWTLAATASAAERNVATVEFFSECVGRKLKYNVALPANYDSSDRRYPVLYLLHGFSGNYTQWARFGAPSAAKTHELIVVMPDGGNSWYIRWAGSEAGQKNDWEGAIVKDLVAHVDSTYRTIAAREGRAIGGLSMGGYGAVVLGLRHPDLFCSIGSYSGALNYARNSAERLARGESLRPSEPPATQDNPQIGSPGFNSQAERTPAGDPFRSAEDCAINDPYQLVLQVPRDKLPHIYLDCGSEDTWLPNSQGFLQVLMTNNIPFTYAQSPGEHRGSYWSREISHAMAVQCAIIERNMKASATSSTSVSEK